MIALAFIAALAGFAMLALSLDRHHYDLLGRPGSPRVAKRIRWGGWLLLLLSLGSLLPAGRPSVSIVLWIGLLTPALLSVSLALTYRERWFVR